VTTNNPCVLKETQHFLGRWFSNHRPSCFFKTVNEIQLATPGEHRTVSP
jgi:hypothetical protein